MRLSHDNIYQVFTLFTYIISVIFLIFVSPLYGDPAVVYWTSKVMRKTGFAYDPVCTKDSMSLCVRAPLYYFLLAITGNYYKVILACLLIIFIFLQVHMIRDTVSRIGLVGLLWPPIYLLFSRTYVDALTALLNTALLLILFRNRNKSMNILLLLLPLLMVLTRETAFVFLPLLVTTLIVLHHIKGDRSLRMATLLMFCGWIIGLLTYYSYIAMSEGNSYSDFQPHIPTPIESYRAVMTVLSSILPWEITAHDVASYLSFVKLPVIATNEITIILRVAINLIAFAILLPIFFVLKRFNSLDSTVKYQFILGLFIAVGLLFLKGDIDFFRHTAYLLPVMPYMVGQGLKELRSKNKYLCNFVIFSFLIQFVLYLLRTIRLFQSGYSFDACDYLIDRPTISSIPYFYETACQ